MKKNLPVKKQNSQVILSKTKSLTSITNKVLSDKISFNDDSWMQRLWDWADENQISHKFPRRKAELLKLTKLEFDWDDSISTLPDEIIYLTKLTELTAHGSLIELPRSIDKLTDLTILELAWNNIRELPKEICNLKKLKYLSIGHVIADDFYDNPSNCLNNNNCLTTLPENLSNLTELETLILGHMPLGDYAGFGNRLTVISKDISNLRNLQVLELSYNKLTKLPAEIGNLTHLTRLMLFCNELIELPKEIVNLINLTFLSLENNPNLTLTKKQKEWILSLNENGCDVWVDDDLEKDIFGIDTNDNKIPF